MRLARGYQAGCERAAKAERGRLRIDSLSFHVYAQDMSSLRPHPIIQFLVLVNFISSRPDCWRPSAPTLHRTYTARDATTVVPSPWRWGARACMPNVELQRTELRYTIHMRVNLPRVCTLPPQKNSTTRLLFVHCSSCVTRTKPPASTTVQSVVLPQGMLYSTKTVYYTDTGFVQLSKLVTDTSTPTIDGAHKNIDSTYRSPPFTLSCQMHLLL